VSLQRRLIDLIEHYCDVLPEFELCEPRRDRAARLGFGWVQLTVQARVISVASEQMITSSRGREISE